MKTELLKTARRLWCVGHADRATQRRNMRASGALCAPAWQPLGDGQARETLGCTGARGPDQQPGAPLSPAHAAQLG